MKKLPLRLVVLASGQGRNFEAIAKASQEGILSSQVVGLLSNKPCGAVDKAKARGIHHQVLPWVKAQSPEQWGRELQQSLVSLKPDLILLAGFLKILSVEVVNKYAWQILNLHPSLLPKYGGPGMYGQRVFEEVIKNRESESGATPHFVTERFDEGPILNQMKIAIHPQETAAELMARIQALEPQFYVETLRRYEAGEFDPLISRLKG